MGEPIVKLDPGGKAPIVSYNVPDKIAYDGRNIIELKLPPLNPDNPDATHDYFNAAASTPPSQRRSFVGLPVDTIESQVRNALETGVYDRTFFPNISTRVNTLRILAPSSTFGTGEADTRNPPHQPYSALLASVGIAVPLANHMANLEPRAVASD